MAIEKLKKPYLGKLRYAQELGVKVDEVIDELELKANVADLPEGGSALPYKVYTALISVNGAGDTVTPIVLENTLGFVPTWESPFAGEPRIIGPVGSFPQLLRTVTWGMVKSSDGVNGYIVESDSFAYSDDIIYFQTLSSGSAGATFMDKVHVEIRVYNAE